MENKNKDVLQKTVRINRYLAMSGIASRRAAEEVVLAGEVRVNGNVVESLGTQVDPERDTVTVHGKRVAPSEHLIYVLLNKPKDYITTAKDEKDRRTVYELLSVRERVFPVGRLDRNTTGVLLFTNDGFLATKLMHPSSEVKKEYHVSIDQSLDEAHREKLSKGIYLDDGKTAPAEIVPVPGTKNREIVVTIHEGRNRQVRRMFESLGYDVVRLHRISYGGVTADGVARGKWRFLTDQEVRKLKSLVGSEARAEKPGRKRFKPMRSGPAHTAAPSGNEGKKPSTGKRFSPADKTFSPDTRRSSPAGKTFSSDKRRSSPADKTFSPDKRRSSPAGKSFSAAERKTSVSGKSFSSDQRRTAPAGRRFSADQRTGAQSGPKFKSSQSRHGGPASRSTSSGGRGERGGMTSKQGGTFGRPSSAAPGPARGGSKPSHGRNDSRRRH